MSVAKVSTSFEKFKSIGALTGGEEVSGVQPVAVLKLPAGSHCIKFEESRVVGILAEPSNLTAQIVFGVVLVVLKICQVFAVVHKPELPVVPKLSVEIAVEVIAEVIATY